MISVTETIDQWTVVSDVITKPDHSSQVLEKLTLELFTEPGCRDAFTVFATLSRRLRLLFRKSTLVPFQVFLLVRNARQWREKRHRNRFACEDRRFHPRRTETVSNCHFLFVTLASNRATRKQQYRKRDQ